MEVEETVIEVGALGEIRFEEGYYVYTGSAFGPGGLSRIERHREVFEEGMDDPHWHIDYLACDPASRLLAVYMTEGRDIECRVAGELPGEGVEGFGCSDCGCGSHLIRGSERSELVSALTDLHEKRWNCAQS